jgi:hypothetical protein
VGLVASQRLYSTTKMLIGPKLPDFSAPHIVPAKGALPRVPGSKYIWAKSENYSHSRT